MKIRASVLVGGIGAILVCIAAFTTLGVVYSFSSKALEDAGLSQAQLLVATPTEQVRGFFEPTIALNRAIQYTVRDPVMGFKLQEDLSAADWRAQWRRVQLFASVAGSFDFQSVNAQLVDSGFTKVQRIHPNVWTHTSLDATNRGANGGVSVIYDEQYYESNFSSVVPLMPNGQNPKFNSVNAGPYKNGNSSFGAMNWFGPFYTVVPVIMSLSMTASLHNASGTYLGFSVINVKIDQINDMLRSVERTENSHVFVFDQSRLIVATSHPNSMFDVSEVDPASAKPRNCFRTSSQSATLNTTSQSCRKALAAFDYAPLQQLAGGSSAVLSTASSVTEIVEVGSERYFVSGRRVQLSVMDGATFNLVVFIPEDDVLGHAKKGRDTAIGISVAVVVVAVIVLFVLVFVSLGSLDDVAQTLTRVGQLDFDHSDVTQSTSVIKEVSDLQQATALTRQQLMKVRSFVPQSVLAHLDQDDDEEEDERTSVASSSHVSGRKTDKSSDKVSVRSHTSRTSGRSSASAVVVGRLGLNMKSEVVNKRVAVLAANLCGFHASVNNNPTLLRREQDGYFRRVLEEARASRGVVDMIQGDHALVTFNAAVPNAQAMRRAMECALRLTKGVRDDGRVGDPPMTVGVSYGVAICGNVGTNEMKRFNVVGAVMKQAWILERLAKHYGVDLLTTMMMMREYSHEFRHKLVDVVRIPGDTDEVPMIVQVMEVMTQANEEWMYQVGESGAGTGNTDHKELTFVEALGMGETREAALAKSGANEPLSEAVTSIESRGPGTLEADLGKYYLSL